MRLENKRREIIKEKNQIIRQRIKQQIADANSEGHTQHARDVNSMGDEQPLFKMLTNEEIIKEIKGHDPKRKITPLDFEILD